MALCVAVSGYALTKNEYVYTPQGRFKITGDNVVSNKFENFDGWTVVADGKAVEDKFNIIADGEGGGSNSIQSLENTAGEGIYFKFEVPDASSAYVVSFKMKGAALDNTRLVVPADGNKTMSAFNVVDVVGNSDHAFGGGTDSLVINTAEELTEEWQTFYYAIPGDGVARTWFISLFAMATSIEFADIQVAPAMQFADLRQRDAMLEKLEVYRNCYDWPAEVLADCGFDEIIANLKAVGDQSAQAVLEEHLATAQEILDEFLKANMDDYFASNEENYLGINTTGSNRNKIIIGDWTEIPGGRAHWNNGDHPDMGHYAGNTAWCWDSPDDPMGIYMQKTLDPGAYVFAIESKAALRNDPTSTSWSYNEAWDPAFAVAYLVKVNEGAEPDTIARQWKDLKSTEFTQFTISAKIEESGTYEFGLKAYCKDAYKTLKNGSAVYVANAALWGKNENKYNQKQLTYEETVRAQITAGREALTKAAEYQADETYLWGKATLKAVMDEVEPKIAAYEAMDQDAIIATYDEDTYVNTLAEETGLLQYEVYQNATKLILDANKTFLAVNDTLTSMQTIIDDAEATLKMRMYNAATGKAALQAAIDKAKGVQATMKAADYSEANAATIVAANEELSEALATFKTTIPAAAIATIADIDFENDAVQDAETGYYSIAGNVGSMEFSNWSTDGTGDQPFEKGYWSNGEQLWKDYLRIGNGTGTVVFDPTENGSMGSNILKVACDMYIQGLSGRFLGFFLKNVVEGENGSEDAEIFALYHNYYNWTTEKNTCNVNIDMTWAKAGGSYANASPADAPEETLTANPLQKTHFEVIMDYGTNTMYCTINSINGSATSDEVALDAIPTKFILQSNYNNNDRRAWFDNLKIQRISTDETLGIKVVNAEKANNEARYNLAGQKVSKTFKGVVVKGGKKLIQK